MPAEPVEVVPIIPSVAAKADWPANNTNALAIAKRFIFFINSPLGGVPLNNPFREGNGDPCH